MDRPARRQIIPSPQRAPERCSFAGPFHACASGNRSGAVVGPGLKATARGRGALPAGAIRARVALNRPSVLLRPKIHSSLNASYLDQGLNSQSASAVDGTVQNGPLEGVRQGLFSTSKSSKLLDITMRIFVVCVLLLVVPPLALVGFKQFQSFRNESREMSKSSAGLPGEVLFFNASWCGPCRQMKPIVTQLRHQGYRLRDVDVDKHRSLAQKYGIHAVPTFVFVEHGCEVKRFSGGTSSENLRKLCSSPAYRQLAHSQSHSRRSRD
jgi:thioredoxin 1